MDILKGNNTPQPKIVTLPSGRKATIRTPNGEDLINADRVMNARDKGNIYALTCALISQCCQIDDEPMVYEDVRKLPAADIFLLMSDVMGVGTLPNAPASPDSSITDLRRAN